MEAKSPTLHALRTTWHVFKLRPKSVSVSLMEEDATTALPDGVTQREHELFLKAREYIDAIRVLREEHEFKDAVTTLIIAGRSIFII